MAIVLEIDIGEPGGLLDYTRYLVLPEREPHVLRDRLNVPALFDFALAPADTDFLHPPRSAYVRVTGLAGALPPGGPRVRGPLFTGFITQEPELEYLGTQNGTPVYAFRCRATSEEYLLNIKRPGLLPPFLNQTAGQVLRFLTEHLLPGRFDTSNVADGAVLPQFSADPSRTWSEIARELAERSGYHYWVLDGKIYFQPLGDQASGVAVDERDPRFRPEALEVMPLGNPIQNDVTVFGLEEPQAYVTEYFVGDGFTSRFPLSAAMYGADSARLLADDFHGINLDTARWRETDPGSHIQLFDGRLNVTGGNGLGQTFLQARAAIELAGELEMIHGEFEFVSASSGIAGGLYAAATLAQAECLAGFEISKIGTGSRLRALVSGVVQAAEVLTQANHHYVLVTRLSADQSSRVQQFYPGLHGSFGGSILAAAVKLTLEVRDISLASPAVPVITTLYEATLALLPAYAFYAPVNSSDLHVVMNFLQVTRPIQASLETQRPGEVSRKRALGFGLAEHDATITVDRNRNQWALEFYDDTIPSAGEKITLRYRAAGRAQAHLRDVASVAAEAALAGDDGVRAAVLQQPFPAPRSSAEAELAALAYLADHTQTPHEGSYATWDELADGYPRSGRFLDVRCESRHPAFGALVRGVTSEFRELGTERILHKLEFGQALRFEELLRQFNGADAAPEPGDTQPLPPVDSTQVASAFLADVPGASLTSFSASFFGADLGAPPPSGGRYVVRRSDQGWSTGTTPGSPQNLITSSTAQSFVLNRTAPHHLFFIRPVDASGKSSRHSCLLAIHYPAFPAMPQALLLAHGVDEAQKPIITATLELNETQLAGVHEAELRDADNATVLARWSFGQLVRQGTVYRGEHIFDNSFALLRTKTMFAYTRNALGEYSAPRSTTVTQLQPLKPLVLAGNSVGQVLEILLAQASASIAETQVQVTAPGGSFSAPAQDVLLPGHPSKFNFVATQTGGWTFRARYRDSLGWSPWSDETQGQIGPSLVVFLVQFFQARELDPSVGAAANSQNLLPNGEFFLGGIAGQEGTHAARYFKLVNAASDGSEVDYLAGSNEVQWKSGVNFASSNPAVRSALTNLGRLLNPGEPVTFSAALRDDGATGFARAMRLTLRSASTPAYDRSSDIAALAVGSSYKWFSVTFTLPASQAVPADLAVEIAPVVPAGQSLASNLFCDKVVLNRGHRPAAFNLALWDVLALAWNAGAGGYDLPATAVAGIQRSTDPGSAGLLAGTGTVDLDPNFTSRYLRQTA